MTLKHNWREIVRYAWSIRFIFLCGLLSGIEFILPVFMDNPPIPRGLFASLAFFISVAAFLARLLVQKSVRG